MVWGLEGIPKACLQGNFSKSFGTTMGFPLPLIPVEYQPGKIMT